MIVRVAGAFIKSVVRASQTVLLCSVVQKTVHCLACSVFYLGFSFLLSSSVMHKVFYGHDLSGDKSPTQDLRG